MADEREVLRVLYRLGVWSARKRKELASILLHHDPPHLKRVYLGGFLLYALGMSVEQATDFIEKHCAWEDFRRETTLRNLRGIHKRGCEVSSASNGPKRSSFGLKGSSNGPKTGVEAFGTEMWIGRCAANGYPLEWHRVYLLG